MRLLSANSIGAATVARQANTLGKEASADHAKEVAGGSAELKDVRSLDFVEIRQGELSADTLNICLEIEQDAWVTPFQWSGWLQSWRHHIGEPLLSIPVTVIVHSRGQPVLILPLAICNRFGVRYLTWCAYQQSDYCAPIVRRSYIERLGGIDGTDFLGRIASRLGGIDLVYLPKQPALIGNLANPFVLSNSVAYHAGAHAISFVAGEKWESALQRRRSAKTRRRLKDKRTALEKLGLVTFRLANNPVDAQTIIESCLKTKSEQLRKNGYWDPFSPSGVRGFLVDYFSANVGQTTWAAALDIDGKPVATAFGFGSRREWLLYQMSMNDGPEARHSPGSHLLMNLMRHCTEIGLKRLDLALGDETYKSEWCDEHMTLKTAVLALTAQGVFCKKMIVLRAALRERIASDPALYHAGKWFKGLAKKIRLPL
jgi:CelD/BcsL family acetyltransferase involved in cellulose biosynthesis